MKHFHGDFAYHPIEPQGDNDHLARRARLVLYHDVKTGPRLFIAKRGELVAGWIVGLEHQQGDQSGA